MATTIVNNIELNSNALHVRDKILQLQAKRGFCWATNSALAKMIGVSKGYLSHQIGRLVKAGYVYRHIERDENGEIAYRQLVAFKDAKETALAEAEVRKIEADRTEQGTRNRLIANGKNLCISKLSIIRAIMLYGAEKVDIALGIVKASCTCRNPLKLFWAALKKGYKAGRIALGYIGTVYTDARRRAVNLPEFKLEEIIEEYKEAEEYKGLSIKDGLALLKRNLRARA